MVDRRRTHAAGFTLAEMMAALAILLVGVTALLSSLTGSIDLRRGTDARLAAAGLVEQALLQVRDQVVRKADGGPLDLALAPLVDQESAQFPGLRWSARVVEDPSRPDAWLVQIDVRWLEEGEFVEEQFLRVLPRALPLRQRVRKFVEDHGGKR